MLKAKANFRLGKVQFQIMQILWRLKEASARQLTDEMNVQSPSLVAHSTVQTLLRELEAKGMVGHETIDRTFVYRALFDEREVTSHATRDFLAHIFNGSIYGLVAHLLANEKLSAAERERLRALIDEEKGS